MRIDRSCSLTVLALLFLAGQTTAATISVPLIGQGSKNNFAASLTPFTGAAIAAMTDSSNATGFTHNSFFGDDISTQISGVQKRFDFDVSGISNISNIPTHLRTCFRQCSISCQSRHLTLERQPPVWMRSRPAPSLIWWVNFRTVARLRLLQVTWEFQYIQIPIESTEITLKGDMKAGKTRRALVWTN